MSYVKKHLKVRAKCLGDGYAELTLLENSGEFGSTELPHKWQFGYRNFLATEPKVRMYYSENFDRYPCDVCESWYDSDFKKNVLKFRVGGVGLVTQLPAKLWPKIKAAIEEYNRYGEEEYQKYLQKQEEEQWITTNFG